MPRAAHVRATILPEGGPPRDLWILDGRWSERAPPAGTTITEIAPDGGYLLPGLVDAHSHISWPHTPDVPADTEPHMDAQRAAYAVTGVVAIRDMGSAFNAVIALPDRPGLPRVRAAGVLLVRNDGFVFEPTTAETLVRNARQQVQLGAPWVKVFTDWTPDFAGREDTAFRWDDALTYPQDTLGEMVRVVHAAGSRVAAHTFSTAGIRAALDAGVDSIEHGWAAGDAEIERMARNGVAWVPMVSIARPMWQATRRLGQPDRRAWIETAMTRMRDTLPRAHSLGVRIFAGTDWFGAITVQDEVLELIALGVPAAAMVGLATWEAHAWLRLTGIEAGEPASLLWLPCDPREDPAVLLRPGACWVHGHPVTPSFAKVRPQFHGWAGHETAPETL